MSRWMEADVYAPVSGEVIAVNDNLQYSPELINQDPYGEGWMVVIEPADPRIPGAPLGGGVQSTSAGRLKKGGVRQG